MIDVNYSTGKEFPRERGLTVAFIKLTVKIGVILAKNVIYF